MGSSVIRTPLIVALLFGALASTGRAQTFVDGSDKTLSPEEAQSIKDMLLGVLADPIGAQLARLRPGASPHTFCGFVNSKNGYGGYVGFKQFAVDFTRKKIGVFPDVDAPLTSREQGVAMRDALQLIIAVCPK